MVDDKVVVGRANEVGTQKMVDVVDKLRRLSKRFANLKKKESDVVARDSTKVGVSNNPNVTVVTVEDSHVHDLHKASLDKEVGEWNVEGEGNRNVDPPLKIDLMSEDFSYLDEDTSMFGLLDMARESATDTFKLAKWTL